MIIGDLLVGNDELIQMNGLYDQQAATYVNDATVSLQIKTMAGVNVGAAITMSYVASSNGVYVGSIEEDASIVVGTSYLLVITVTASGDRVGTWTSKKTAKQRTI